MALATNLRTWTSPPYEVFVARVHQEHTDGALADPGHRPESVFDLLGAPGGYILENVDPDAPDRSRGVQHVLRSRDLGSGESVAGLKDLGRHPVHPELVVAPDQVAQALLLAGRGRIPPLRPPPCNSEVAAVPLGDRRRLLPVPESRPEEGVDEGDGQVGGEELVREPGSVQGHGAADRVDYVADLQRCC